MDIDLNRTAVGEDPATQQTRVRALIVYVVSNAPDPRHRFDLTG